MPAAARTIRLSQIDAHPHNVRVDLGDLRPLADNIRRLGILTPVIVEVYGNRYRLRDGHRRVAAARQAGRNTVPAIVHSEALQRADWLTQAAATASHRNALQRRDQGRGAAALRDEGYGWADIADALSCSEPVARQLATEGRGTSDPKSKPWKPPNQVSVRRVEAALEQGPEAVRALLVSLRTPPTTEAVR